MADITTYQTFCTTRTLLSTNIKETNEIADFIDVDITDIMIIFDIKDIAHI
jgi:hypothetical protein